MAYKIINMLTEKANKICQKENITCRLLDRQKVIHNKRTHKIETSRRTVNYSRHRLEQLTMYLE